MPVQVNHTDHKDIQALILDMDGVLWRGSEPIGDLPEIFRQIQVSGLSVALATNNSTLTTEAYLKKLRSFGLEIEASQVVTSAEATATYLVERFPSGSTVFVIGEAGLMQTLVRHGFRISSENAQAVVVGLDREFTYEKLATGMRLVGDGAMLIGTNPDNTLPQPGGSIPGAGSMIAAIEAATGVDSVVIGKPGPEMFLQALRRLGTRPTNTMVVGDRLETDIAGGQASGCPTALVLTGAANRDDAAGWDPPPTFISDTLADLILEIQGKTL